MCKFIQVIQPLSLNFSATLHYIPEVRKCFGKYYKYLQDDFASFDTKNILSFLEKLCPNFWIILDYNSDDFMGFVYLDNFVGNKTSIYSAELTTCFDRKAWGTFTRYSAKLFLKKCFDEFGLYKIKAQIYPDNHRIKTLLKNSGFIYETTLKKETLRLGKPQDIEVYSLYRDYYYKTR